MNATQFRKHIDKVRRRQTEYRQPSRAQVQAFTSIIEALDKAAQTKNAAQRTAMKNAIARSGYEIEPVVIDNEEIWLLSENAASDRGQGLYAVRCNSTSSDVVMAPHSFFDKDTGKIATRLFAKSSFKWLFVNTHHRYRGHDGESKHDAQHPADVAHAAGSLFQAATRGLLHAQPDRTFLQVHGFSESDAERLSAVISTGDRQAHALVEPFAAAAPKSWNVQVFGRDVDRLGATTNVQGKLIRGHGGRFVHLELSRALRKRIVTDGDEQAVLDRILQTIRTAN